MEIPRNPTESHGLTSIVASIATQIGGPLSPGDVAALRRLGPRRSDCAAFWRVLAQHPEAIPYEGPVRDDLESRWACILRAMATLAGQHDPSQPLGRALANADVSEPRVLRLLSASGANLADVVRVLSHHLASKAVPVNQVDLAALVLSDGGPNEERVRRRIARSYFASQANKES